MLRIDCVRMLAVAKSGHLDSSLSAADIVTALYYRVLRHDPANPCWHDRDRFVLSKGHAAPILYAALARHGYFPLEDLMGLRKIGAQLQGHPDMNKTPGVEVSTGSLGQGLSMSLGIALALRLDGLDAMRTSSRCSPTATVRRARPGRRRPPRPTSPTAAANLTAIVDYNHLQTDGTTEEVMDIADMRAKFDAFGWDTVEIDGHDMSAIVEALESSRDGDRPGRDHLPDQEGPRRLLDGGPLRLPRQAADAEQAEEALTELEALYKEQTEALEGDRQFETVPADGADERRRR